MNINEIGERLRHCREFRNYTQEYVASELGISQNNYSRLERDPGKLSLKRLNHLSEILDVDLYDLIMNDKFSPLSGY